MDKKYISRMEKIYRVEGFEALIRDLSQYLEQNGLSQQEVEELAENFLKITAGGGDYFDTSAGILFKNFYDRFPNSKILKEHLENIKKELFSNGNDYFSKEDVQHKIHEFNRTQTYKKESILKRIDTVIKNTVNSYNKDNDTVFEKIIIDARCMAIGLYVSTSFIKNGESSKIKGNIASFDLMNEIKSEMYEQAKYEGAWFFCRIEVLSSLEYNIHFYYDDKEKLSEERLKSSDNFVDEFSKYPRSKEFTPEWWQNIFDKKEKYIKK